MSSRCCRRPRSWLLGALCARAVTGQLKVIGAGLPRTGTESLSEALTILGYGWNTHNHCNYPNQCQWAACSWMREGNATDLLQDVKDQAMGFVADEPLCLAYKELAEHFTEAKVVLTVRDSAEQWLRSFAQMQGLVFGGTLPESFRTPYFLALDQLVSYCDQLPHTKFDCDIFTDTVSPEAADHCKRGYENHNEDVQRTIPKDRLLVFNVKDGWEPLCKFLGKPVPSVPFPNNNNYVNGLLLRKSMAEQEKLRRAVFLSVALGVVVTVLYVCCRSRLTRRKVAKD